MREECLICRAPLQYLETDEVMECAICHKNHSSKAKCTKGHFVCDECHTSDIDEILSICFKTKSDNPIEILEDMMSMPSCHMHGPEHHIMVGCALLTAYRNAGGDVDLHTALAEMHKRAKQVPGGACGFWGACGAGISTGMFVSIATKSTPLAEKAWGLSNQMTAKALDAIGRNGGPRCCKRDSYLAITEAVKFAEKNLGVKMELKPIICSRGDMNNQCRKAKCPFYKKDKKKIAFICVHNSCRSQIAEALGRHLASDVFESYSAGTETKPQINQDAVRIMKEIYGIDMEKTQYSKLIGDIPDPDVAISMGCNVSCPFIGRAFDDNWQLEDPTGKSDEEFKIIIRKIEENILKLKAEHSPQKQTVTVVAKKRPQKDVRIDYLYLDLKTCDRCIGTDDVLERVIKELKPSLALAGYGVSYNKTEIATEQDAIKHRFLSSPTIRINGRDICDEVKESDCGCCGEISGTQVDCRTFEYNGKLYNIPPKAMLAEAILKYTFTAETDSRQIKYQLPENLKKFFKGKENKKKLL